MNFLAKLQEKVNPQPPTPNYDIFVERPALNPVTKLFYIIGKNLKLLIRSKISALIFLLGPLLVIFFVALAFNTSALYDLNVAAYSEAYSPLSESVLTGLSDAQYNVIRLNSEQDCIDAVKFSDFQVCVVFPANLVLDNTASNVIKIYVDNSRLNIANLVASQISTKVSVEASALSTELVTEILSVLDTANTETIQSQSLISNLITRNAELTSDLGGVSTELDDLDFTYEAIDTTAIDTEISDIKSANNLSSAAFSDLNALIDSLESDYNSLAGTVDTAADAIDSATTVLPSAEAKLATDKTSLEEVDTNLQTVTAGIEGIEIKSVSSIVSPLQTSVEPISTKNNYLLYILPTILVLIVMFVTLLMSSTAIITEKESRAYFRNFITPTNEFLFMLGEYLSNLIVLTFQVVIILGVLYLFLREVLDGMAFVYTGIALLILGTFFILLGMLFGYLFSTKQTVTLAAITAGIIMLFFSNTILPLETLSSYTRSLLQYNPFIMGESILKKLLLFGSPASSITTTSLILIGLSVAVLIGAIVARTVSKKYLNTG